MGNVILSAFSDEYADSIEEQLFALKHFGFSHMEVRALNGKNISLMSREEVLEAKRLLDAAGIKASAIGSPLGKIRLDQDMDAHMEMAKRIFSYANQLGAKYIRVFSFYPPTGKDITAMKREVLTAMEKLVVLARQYGVTLCHENESNIYGQNPQEVADLLTSLPTLRGIPQIPGGYITGRYLNNAFVTVITNYENAADTLYENVELIQEEIDAKRREFGLTTAE